MRTLLDRAGHEIDVQFGDSPRLRAKLHTVVGESYMSFGMWEKAGEHLPQAQQIFVQLEGEEHPDTLAVMNDMTTLLMAIGDTEGALEQQRRVARVSRSILGWADPMTLESEGNLAVSFMKAGREGEAARTLASIGMAAVAPAVPATPGLVQGEAFVVVESGGARFSWGGPTLAPAFSGEAMLVEKLVFLTRGDSVQADDRNRAAWCLLTTRSPELRDPQQALTLASLACEQTSHSDPLCMDTLSLALFRCGEPEDAAENQRQALNFLEPRQTLLRADMERALAVFEGRLDEADGLGKPLFVRFENEFETADVNVVYGVSDERAVVRVREAAAFASDG